MDGRDQRQLGEFIQVIEFIGLLGQEFARLVEIICKAYHSLEIYWNIFLKTGKAWIKGRGKVSWGG